MTRKIQPPPLTTPTYFDGDYGRTLFPLQTTQIIVNSFSADLTARIYNHILSPSDTESHFLPQQRAYAAKHDLFLRRTVKLDPIAEYFLYDIVYRNRRTFKKDHRDSRKSFGYRFSGGRPSPASIDYGDFKRAVWFAEQRYKFWVSTDIASYFNSIYHHDLVTCVRDLDWSEDDVNGLGLFLRQINSGRSVDCLPQGIHPAKVLGAEFLRFVDNSHLLKSDLILRFQDDIHVFDNDRSKVSVDLLTLQELIGEKGLSLNASKTDCGPEGTFSDIEDEVDNIRSSLLRKRRQVVARSYDGDDAEEAEPDYEPLTPEQVNYLLDLITSSEVEESDVELVLTLLRKHGEEVMPRMLRLLRRFPGLSKSFYSYARFSDLLEGTDDQILEFIVSSPDATEFQLFWIAKLATDVLPRSPKLGEILFAIYEHPHASILCQAKILEHPDQRFGLKELREEQLRSGRSDWIAWAAAMGTRTMKPGSRNHLLTYFANASPTNSFIADSVRRLPWAQG